MTRDFPMNAEKYAESPVFTQDTVPDALRKDHSTKEDVWGKIVVQDGKLIYLRADRPAQIVTSAEAAIIWPEEIHSVQPSGNVTFKVEFYRVPIQEAE